ncbi:MAG: hypothetical protein QN720_02425 [Nitrososphaeraceae archaeon]|nr:hypothetical protein [Nitrososphaeraceae archaeon]MDW0331895.1 hypothetical protein [Nitrososphaeraceae archaeon]
MKIDFSTDGMEILVSFFSEENSSEDNITETINIGQAQIFMEIFQKDNSLKQIKVLLSTPLSQELRKAAVRRIEDSKRKILPHLKQTQDNPSNQDIVVEELEEKGRLKEESESQEGGKQYEDEIPRQGK